MLLEADLVGVVRVRLVAVDGLRAVGVLDRGFLWRLVGGCCAAAHASELRCSRSAPLGTCRTARVAGDGRRCLEAVELCRGVHLRCLLVDLGFRAVHVAVGDGARLARARELLVQGIRVDEGAVAGMGLRAVVEYPHNLGLSVSAEPRAREGAYVDHGQEDVAGTGSLEGRDGRVDERIDRRRGEDESSAEEADNLL
jgi:hypothetical protein